MSARKFDVVIIGGGHNGLVAAAYLTRAGKSVAVLEANAELGGATASVRAFAGLDANLSRYSYLVSLLPDQIIKDLGLNFRTLSRKVASYTPFHQGDSQRALHVSRVWDDRTDASFKGLEHGAADTAAWKEFYGETATFAKRIASSLLNPLPTRAGLRDHVDMHRAWDYLVANPIGEVITTNFRNDLVRGVVLTDALIGTFASAYSLQANKCFLYHIIGNGTGEWKVPQGGMGQLIEELERVTRKAGVAIFLNSRAAKVASDGREVSVTLENGDQFIGNHLLSNAAPQTLAKLRGKTPSESLDGSQLKINMLVKRLPGLKSGDDPREAFAGTFHANESFEQLQAAYHQAAGGQLPSPLPLEMYCHTLTDPTILSAGLQREGYHSLTLFALHTPASLFDTDHDKQKEMAVQAALASLNEFLTEPIESVLATTPTGEPTIEVKTPQEIETAIGMPRGNIFHQDLSFPFREHDEPPGWGVETDDPLILVCGAGARRGGGVSGIPGHNAAMAVLHGASS